MTILWGKPTRLQLRRVAKFNLQVTSLALNGLEAVHCARPSDWGNPFTVESFGSARMAVEAFRLALCEYGRFTNQHGRVITQDHVRHFLRGKNLACFCPLETPHCHVNVLLEVANS
jgi:hypothetical protein